MKPNPTSQNQLCEVKEGTSDPLIHFRPFLIALVLVCFWLSPKAQAVSPPPDGGYPGFNTAEGTNALKNLTTGVGNAAIGWYSLFSNTDGSFNTALGAGTLFSNVGAPGTFQGVENTAIGAAALLLNTTGGSNTAVGSQALLSNTEGSHNTANGRGALHSNTTGDGNTANGAGALSSNTEGSHNTATGVSALVSNTGSGNTAVGYIALFSNAEGEDNTANGRSALQNLTTGSGNTAIGATAGFNLTTGDGNVCIGVGVFGVAGESNTTRIRNIYSTVASARAVYVDSDNKIGTLSSSRRFKEEIKPMDKVSEMLFALKPVTFRYKKEIDRAQALSFGLIAEEVAQINPDLITRDEEGNPQTVRYEAVNAMLLNEFLKQHLKFKEQEATITQLKTEIETVIAHLKEQDSKIQRVSNQRELDKPASRVVLSNP